MTSESNHPATPDALRLLLEEFRGLNPVGSVGSVCVFLALGEGGGELDVNELAERTGMPVVSVCRYADGLVKFDPRRGRGGVPQLARQIPGTLGQRPRYGLTDAGHALFGRLFPGDPAEFRAAA